MVKGESRFLPNEIRSVEGIGVASIPEKLPAKVQGSEYRAGRVEFH